MRSTTTAITRNASGRSLPTSEITSITNTGKIDSSQVGQIAREKDDVRNARKSKVSE